MGLIILKQILNKWVSILVIFCLCFSFVSPVFAETSLDLTNSEEFLENIDYDEYVRQRDSLFIYYDLKLLNRLRTDK